MTLLALEITILILLIILLLIFIALPLYITARILDEDEGLLKALGTTILLIITFFGCLILIPIPIVGLIVAIIVNLLVIKVVYETDWGKAFVMWIVAIVMVFVIVFIVAVLVGLSILAFLALT
ncbi:MAG: hypothetical protein JSW00_17650 [Thermoplasmata archaeon]|nr:MAG: hypothetical protein JSW00_17650 [Thermoplasmata archaeon]